MLLCPLCLTWHEFSGLDEDHAPPKAEQSSMGPSRVVVMTCRDDNQTAGHSYEADAHHLQDALTPVPEPFCPVHQRERTTRSGLVVFTDRAAFELTDTRAAYLVAFATLGYRWVMSPRMDNLRLRLREGDLKYAATDYEVLCTHDADGLEPFHVYEIREPVAAVLVTGAHAGVLLPCHTSPLNIRDVVVKKSVGWRSGATTGWQLELRATLGHRWSWPQQFVRPGGTPEKAWDDVDQGSMFHYDRCSESAHHSAHAVPRVEMPELVPVPGPPHAA